MSERIDNICSEIDAIAKDAASTFGHLGRDQLNWKSAARTWSIAQCFDHLITVNTLYFPLFERMRSSGVAGTWWERNSPLSSFFGRYLIRTLSPEYKKRSKTTRKGYPSASDLDGEIVSRFSDHQTRLSEHINALSPEIDLAKHIITSPMMGFVTYSLDDALTILAVHERRHLDQARRVLESDGFAD